MSNDYNLYSAADIRKSALFSEPFLVMPFPPGALEVSTGRAGEPNNAGFPILRNRPNGFPREERKKNVTDYDDIADFLVSKVLLDPIDARPYRTISSETPDGLCGIYVSQRLAAALSEELTETMKVSSMHTPQTAHSLSAHACTSPMHCAFFGHLLSRWCALV